MNENKKFFTESNMMPNPLVSIITPNFNGELFISYTIDSVLMQSYQNWEMLIVDDCSTDSSIDIVKKYQKKDNRIKLFQLEKNSGAAVTRNKAIEEAKGEFIAFLDNDDLWAKEKLTEQINFMQKNNYNFTYSNYDIINEKHKLITSFIAPNMVNYKKLIKSNHIGCLTAVYNQKKLGKIYMPLIKKRQDLGLWLKILKIEPYAYNVNKILGKYRIRGRSISSNKIKSAYYQWKLYREVEKLSLLKSILYFGYYAIYGFFKYKK